MKSMTVWAGHSVGLTGGSGDALEERGVASLGDGVLVTEGAQHRTVEARQHVPGGHVVGAGRIIERGRHQGGEDPGPGLVGVVGERSVVGGDHLGRQVRGGTAVDDGPDREVLGLLGELLPCQEGVAHGAVARR